MTGLTQGVCCFSVLIAMCASPALALTHAEIERLRAGEVLITSRSEPHGGVVDGSIVINAPTRLVYTLVSDPKQLRSYSPNITSVTILEDHGMHKRIRMRVRQLGLIDDESEVNATYTPFAMVNWEQVKGRFASMVGGWRIVGFGNGTMLSYHLDIDTGMVLPSFVVNLFLQTSIPELLRNVRQRFAGGDVTLAPGSAPAAKF